jgi:1-acyl-sn-glycerol-3-phosphate acyltransferase
MKANLTDWGASWLNWVDGLNRLWCVHYHRLRLVELALPAAGPAIVVANHISGLDPLLMIACSRRPLRFLIAREQYRRFGLRWLFKAAGCIPVDRERSPEKALRQAFKALRDGQVVALFPHGKIHLADHPPRPTKAGAARLAAISKAPVIPLRISGVAREGRVISAVLVRGMAKVEPLPPIEAGTYTADRLYSEIENAVGGDVIDRDEGVNRNK